MKILIGTPTYDRRIDIELVKLFLNLERENKHEFDYVFPVSSHISRNRNLICLEALKAGHDAVLFLDSDIAIPDSGFLEKMIETAFKLDAKIVGGAYMMKKEEIAYVAGSQKDGKFDNIKVAPDAPVEVECVGTGIMLVYADVLKELKDPWFTIIDKPLLEVMPEDFEFCRKAKEAGFKVALDPRFTTQHYGAKAWTHSYE